ncbi:MAG: cation:proton antiporter, partial [Patescibacteria group bacterium]
MTDIFLELSLVLGLALFVSLIVKWLRQPLIIGYIITGIVAGQAFLAWVSRDSLESFSQIGITLLLFIVGLSLNPKTLKEVGKVAFLTGIGQIIFTCIIGYLVARWLNFGLVPALYLAMAMTFSSTVIILRLLHERGDQDTLYGRIAIGFLLVQDFVVMIILAMVAGISNAAGIGFFTLAVELFAKLIIIGIVVVVLMKFLVPKIDSKLAHNKEILFLASLALAFIMAALFNQLGFSMELGALLAGIMLSLSPYEIEISSRVRPLRDFFLIIFFIVMGSRLEIALFDAYLWQAIVFSLFILIGNPLIVMLLMGSMG